MEFAWYYGMLIGVGMVVVVLLAMPFFVWLFQDGFRLYSDYCEWAINKLGGIKF